VRVYPPPRAIRSASLRGDLEVFEGLFPDGCDLAERLRELRRQDVPVGRLLEELDP
jgi:hypothetical protein